MVLRSGLVTTTLEMPEACAPVAHVSLVELTVVGELHTTPPTVAVAPKSNPVPTIETNVPPPAAPEDGVTLLTVGAGSPLPVPWIDSCQRFK